MSEGELRQLLQKSGLSRIADEIIRLSRPAIRVHTRPADEAEIPVGASKMGGFPDLPEGFEYPRWHEAMGFISQFNLAELHPLDLEKRLPDHGLLSFFYETDGEPLYSEHLAGVREFTREEARKGWCVLYFDDLTTLQRFSAFEDVTEDEFYPCCKVSFSHALTLPEVDAVELLPLGITQPERNALIDISVDVNAGGFGDHQLLGHPFTLALPNFLEASDSLKRWQYAGVEERIEIEREISRRWMLLFQVNSSGDLNMDWAGGGLVYFAVERERLLARDLSQVWLEMQFL